MFRDPDERVSLLALQKLFHAHPRIAHELLRLAGTAQALFAQDPRIFRAAFGDQQKLWESFRTFQGWEELRRTLQRIARAGGMMLGHTDPRYPRMLREIQDPPVALIVRGALCDLSTLPCIALVGSRKATLHGREMAFALAEGLAQQGFGVISGMAFGIDAAAHRGALQAAGVTIAVLGCGVDIPYPASHQSLAKQILRDGALLSEFPWGMPPYPSHFPQRNRIISGLSLGTVIVEAAKRSGSLITARFALEQGREVCAVPGLAATPQTGGTHQLLRDGAALVERAEDVLEIIEPLCKTRPYLKRAGHLGTDMDKHSPLLRVLHEHRAVHVDDLIRLTGMHAASLLEALTLLQLEGAVEELPGQRWQRKG